MKKTNYRETLGSFQIHMKDGKEKFLNEVARWYEAMYPARADFFRTNLRNLREINKNPDGSYKDAKDREWRVRYRVPTELLLFIQRWVPDFGKESEDIDLLVRVWCDLVRPGKDRRPRTPINWSRRPNESVSRPENEARLVYPSQEEYPGSCPHWRYGCCHPDGEPDCVDCARIRNYHREELRAESREDARVPPQELLARD